jgi:hypothetical protein
VLDPGQSVQKMGKLQYLAVVCMVSRDIFVTSKNYIATIIFTSKRVFFEIIQVFIVLLFAFLAPLIETKVLPVTVLLESSKKLEVPEHAPKYAAAVLVTVVENIGSLKAGEIWMASGLTWDQFMAPELVPQFIEANVSLLNVQKLQKHL